MAKKYPTATGLALMRAYNRATRALDDPRITRSKSSAGFIMPNGAPKGEGYRVFVEVVQFSEAKLKRYPLSGGLAKG